MNTYWLLGKKGFDKLLPTPPPIGWVHYSLLLFIFCAQNASRRRRERESEQLFWWLLTNEHFSNMPPRHNPVIRRRADFIFHAFTCAIFWAQCWRSIKCLINTNNFLTTVKSSWQWGKNVFFSAAGWPNGIGGECFVGTFLSIKISWGSGQLAE
jgi:hypothetical protein